MKLSNEKKQSIRLEFEAYYRQHYTGELHFEVLTGSYTANPGAQYQWKGWLAAAEMYEHQLTLAKQALDKQNCPRTHVLIDNVVHCVYGESSIAVVEYLLNSLNQKDQLLAQKITAVRGEDTEKLVARLEHFISSEQRYGGIVDMVTAALLEINRLTQFPKGGT